MVEIVLQSWSFGVHSTSHRNPNIGNTITSWAKFFVKYYFQKQQKQLFFFFLIGMHLKSFNKYMHSTTANAVRGMPKPNMHYQYCFADICQTS